MSFHQGKFSENSLLSWGTYHNISFEELLDNILDTDDLDSVKIGNFKEKFSTIRRVYMPAHGYCLQYKHDYNKGDFLEISFKKIENSLSVYITDPQFSTHYGIYYRTHLGDKIK